MLKKIISYTDYEGNQRKETYWFNLNKAEIIEMQACGSLREYARISDTQNVAGVVEILKDVILKAYGEKSSDGKRFLKKDKDGVRLADAFAETEAYSELFMELATNPAAFEAFIRGVVPNGFLADDNEKENEEPAAISVIS